MTTRTSSIKFCKKVRYPSEAFAMLDIARIRNQSTRDKVPLRAYLCPMCNYWHLTSKALSEQDKSLVEQIKALKSELAQYKHYKNEVTIVRTRCEHLKEENKKMRKQINDEACADERVKELNQKITKLNKEYKKLRENNSYLISENLQLKSKH